MPDIYYNQGYIYQKSNTPYEDIFDRVESNRWSKAFDQHGNSVLVLDTTEHEYDCCCVACIDDDTVTEHLKWVDEETKKLLYNAELGDEEE